LDNKQLYIYIYIYIINANKNKNNKNSNIFINIKYRILEVLASIFANQINKIMTFSFHAEIKLGQFENLLTCQPVDFIINPDLISGDRNRQSAVLTRQRVVFVDDDRPRPPSLCARKSRS